MPSNSVRWPPVAPATTPGSLIDGRLRSVACTFFVGERFEDLGVVTESPLLQCWRYGPFLLEPIHHAVDLGCDSLIFTRCSSRCWAARSVSWSSTARRSSATKAGARRAQNSRLWSQQSCPQPEPPSDQSPPRTRPRSTQDCRSPARQSERAAPRQRLRSRASCPHPERRPERAPPPGSKKRYGLPGACDRRFKEGVAPGGVRVCFWTPDFRCQRSCARLEVRAGTGEFRVCARVLA